MLSLSDADEWEISVGIRHSDPGSMLTGTGTASKQLGGVTLDYTIERDESKFKHIASNQ